MKKMTNKEIKELKERTYAIGWSGFPIDTLFNDIRDNNDPRFNKDLAYQDFKKIIDEIYILKAKAQKYDEKETPKKPYTKMNEHNHIDRHCPGCNSFVYSFDIYCGRCGQKMRSDEDDK